MKKSIFKIAIIFLLIISLIGNVLSFFQAIQQQISIINAITDPLKKAEMYKKVFGECCDTPQIGCNCLPKNL